MSVTFFRGRWAEKYLNGLVLGFLSLLVLVVATTELKAHARNENYVWLNVEETGLSGRFELAYDDIRDRLGIDIPMDQAALEAALEGVAPQVQEYISANFSFIADGAEIQFSFDGVGPAPGAEDLFAYFAYTTEPFDVPDRITLRNDLMLSWDAPLYRSLAVVEYDRQRGIEYPPEHAVMAFGPNSREQEMNLADLQPVLTPRDFLWQGVLHVIAGPDHVLFLLALLLTSVLRLRPPRTWVPVDGPARAAWNAFLIVTLFAVAHSISLTLTVLGILQPNIQLIETLIAFSIVAVALNNLWPVLDTSRWLLIVFFGLFHGMGFASAMSNLQFRMVEPTKILINFNAGIEIGQLLIVAIVLPLIYPIRATEFFRKGLFRFGNLAIAGIAGYWTISRALGL